MDAITSHIADATLNTESKALPALPREVVKHIITFAMTAADGVINMPCLTGRVFEHRINMACLTLE